MSYKFVLGGGGQGTDQFLIPDPDDKRIVILHPAAAAAESQQSDIKQYSSGSGKPLIARIVHLSPSNQVSDTLDATDLAKFTRSQNYKKWRQDIRENGFAKCSKSPKCGMCFLSAKGMEVHSLQCTGESAAGFVKCPDCENKFTTFQNVERHRKTKHPNRPFPNPNSLITPVATSPALPNRTYRGPKSIGRVVEDTEESFSTKEIKNDSSVLNSDQKIDQIKRRISGIFEEEEISRKETKEELHARILRDSKLLGTPRSVGRPRKNPEAHKPQENTYQGIVDQIKESTKDSNEIVCLNQGEEVSEEFKVQAAKILSYKKKVLEFEKLAEDATKAALEEQTSCLLQMEEELKEREMKAKEKLASAVQVLEQSQLERKRRVTLQEIPSNSEEEPQRALTMPTSAPEPVGAVEPPYSEQTLTILPQDEAIVTSSDATAENNNKADLENMVVLSSGAACEITQEQLQELIDQGLLSTLGTPENVVVVNSQEESLKPDLIGPDQPQEYLDHCIDEIHEPVDDDEPMVQLQPEPIVRANDSSNFIPSTEKPTARRSTQIDETFESNQKVANETAIRELEGAESPLTTGQPESPNKTKEETLESEVSNKLAMHEIQPKETPSKTKKKPAKISETKTKPSPPKARRIELNMNAKAINDAEISRAETTESPAKPSNAAKITTLEERAKETANKEVLAKDSSPKAGQKSPGKPVDYVASSELTKPEEQHQVKESPTKTGRKSPTKPAKETPEASKPEPLAKGSKPGTEIAKRNI